MKRLIAILVYKVTFAVHGGWGDNMVSKMGLVSLAMISCLALSGCSFIPNHSPQLKNYAASFSIDNRAPFLAAPKGQYQTQFDVVVSDWNQNYDQKNCEVFLIVTDKDNAPVTDLETNNPECFSYGGWFSLDAENLALESLGLQPFPTHTSINSWFNVVNTPQANSQFIVRTNKPVNPKDWRLVIMATRGEQGTANVLWTKVVSPS